MQCEQCKTEAHRLRCKNSIWLCMQCIPSIDFPETLNIKDTVNYKNYFKNQGNVSALRVEEFKRRCIAPHGNGEVVLKTRFGRITDTLA